MFFQNDKDLMFNAKSDCYIFDILKIHELVGNHFFTRQQIKQLREVSVREKFIGQDGYINAKGISGLASVASGLTGHNVYIKRVDSNANYNFLIGEFMRIVSGGKRYEHFNLMADLDREKVGFDPWSSEGAKTTHYGNIIGYRYIFSEAV